SVHRRGCVSDPRLQQARPAPGIPPGAAAAGRAVATLSRTAHRNLGTRDALLPRRRIRRPPPGALPRAVRHRGPRPALAPAAAPGTARPSRIARLLSGVTAAGNVS